MKISCVTELNCVDRDSKKRFMSHLLIDHTHFYSFLPPSLSSQCVTCSLTAFTKLLNPILGGSIPFLYLDPFVAFCHTAEYAGWCFVMFIYSGTFLRSCEGTCDSMA